MTKLFSALFLTLLLATQSYAQQRIWVQIEAQPTLAAAQDRARAYATMFDNVNGFALGSGWYGIALGPYAEEPATSTLTNLRNQGLIPADSFIADGSRFKFQFWPIGATIGTTDTAPVTTDTAEPAASAIIAPSDLPDETPSEARASEALLDRPERELLQTALNWAGYYDAAIDGAFGRGTRSSMANWQEANNYEVTGILTTRQRADLMGQYNEVLTGMDLIMVRDEEAGLEIKVPTGVVSFDRYDPPFAHFVSKNDFGAGVLLISQSGDQNRLFGLYQIMQTLDIVPQEGPRTLGERSFEIDGINDDIHSYTYVTQTNGALKGFSLIWPAGDEGRRARVLSEMKASFVALDGVLDPALSSVGEEQAIDLVSGLQVRQPKLSRSGFYISRSGEVLTTTETLDACDSVMIDDAHLAEIAYRDDALGIAVLRPVEPLAPLGIATFQTAVPRLQDEVAVGGYPYGGLLTMPTLTFGRLADIRGLNGEETLKRLALTAQAGDAGGPVYDTGGAVLGLLLPKAPLNGQVLPPDVSFTLETDAILASLATAGVAVETTDTMAFMPPETLTLHAADMTVLVSCW